MLADILLGEGNLTDSRTLVDSIAGLSSTENLNYGNYMTVLLDLADSGKTIIQMDSTQLQTMQDVIASNTVVAASAEVAVSAATFEQFEHPIVKLSGGPGKKGDDEENEEKNNDEDEPVADLETGLFRLYPNPNDGTMQLDYLLDEGQSGELLIFDMIGRKVSGYQLKNNSNTLTIRENDLGVGMYFYRISVDDTVVEQDKLMIMK